MIAQNSFVYDIWYFAGVSSEFKRSRLERREIAGQPITLGRDEDGKIFALRDICPHRAALLSAGRLMAGTVECPYHGWRFSVADGRCTEIPAMCADQSFDSGKIRVRTYPVREDGHLVWIYISRDKRASAAPDFAPPHFDIASKKPIIDETLLLGCHVDHAMTGLMDPAHGPNVHKQWWWRSEKSMYEKAKAFEPRPLGFAMAAHTPSSNSFAYKLLGGKPVTEITFILPGIRTEEITVGEKKLLSFTAVTPINEKQTYLRQLFFTDMGIVRLLKPIIAAGARTFLQQDGDIVEVQREGLEYDPSLMLIGDADVQSKWCFALKKEWAASRAEGRAFVNPVKAQTLRWRS